MGVARQHHGKRLGKRLGKHLITALILQAVDCYRHPALPSFIGMFGFVEFDAADGQTRLFLPLETGIKYAEALIGG
jgi:predicted N-acetyltransferase YhbS